MIIKCLGVLTMAVSLFTMTACGGTHVERIDPSSTVDLTGVWNDTDSRLVAEEMIADSLKRPWITNFMAQSKGQKPIVRVAPDAVVIRTNGDVIAHEIFLNDVRREFINSGQVTVVSTNDEASVTRSELAQQQTFATAETKKKQQAELGADYMLHGSIQVQDQVEGRESVKFYSVDLILTHVETREQVWIGNKKIKKLVTQARNR